MLTIGVPHDEISGALQKSQQRNQEKEQPTSEPAKSKFQGYPPVDNPGDRRVRKSGLRSRVKASFFVAFPARSTGCADCSGLPLSNGCQASTRYFPGGKFFRLA